VSIPRVITKCPLCDCLADHLFQRKTSRWKCTFCGDTWTEADLAGTAVVLGGGGKCPVHGDEPCSTSTASALSKESLTLEPGRFEEVTA